MSGDDGFKLNSKGELSVRRDTRPKDTKSGMDQSRQLCQEKNASDMK